MNLRRVRRRSLYRKVMPGRKAQMEKRSFQRRSHIRVRIVADGYGSEEACAEISAAVSGNHKGKIQYGG